ncbi:MAG: hypothetical protein PHX08_01195 [Lachnospiraceae bacterium]|nr:hypothetical protein [Lachnospiraceae bacterium]
MWTLLFIVTTMICAMKWLAWRVSTAAVLYYISKNGYPLPDNEELKECTRIVAEKILKRK